MTDTDDDSVDRARIDSDSNIYAAVEESDTGVEINAGATPVEKPDLHEEYRRSPERVGARGTEEVVDSNATLGDAVAIGDVASNWLIGLDTENPGSTNMFEVWIPSGDADVEQQGSRRLSIRTSGQSVTLGHGLRQTLVDYVFIRTAHQMEHALPDGYQLQTSSATDSHIRHLHDSGISAISGASGRLHSASMGPEDVGGEWIRGSSNGRHPTVEIFVPIEDFEFNIQGSSTQIEYTDTSIVRVRDDERTPVTERQSGLYVDQFHTISEDLVPTHIDNYEGNTDVYSRE